MPLSLSFQDTTFSLFQRPASGDIVIVHMDSRSIQALRSWPWPRSHYGQVVDRLNEAGADMIAFDVDFSSPSIAEEDKAFAAAIERAAGKVLLASHVQPLSAGNPELTITLPMEMFLENALWGDVNVTPPRGLARVASISRLYSPEEPRPSFSAIIAQNGAMPASEFVIDYSIDRRTIPFLSFVDVMNGRFDPERVRGKRIIVGATAIELGDRVSVPIWGVIPGVEVNAIIAETLMQGRILVDTGLAGQFALIVLMALLMNPKRMTWGVRTVALGLTLSIGLAVGASMGLFLGLGYLVDPLPAIVAILACIFSCGVLELGSRNETVMRERSTSNMRQAMITKIVEDSSDGILVVRDSGRIELCNDQAASLLNITRKALTGGDVQDYLPAYTKLGSPASSDPDATRTGELQLNGASGDVMIELFVRRTPLGSLNKKDMLGTRHLDIYTLRDVTAVRMARAAELRAQEERLTAERAKTNFVANMSHELRTPLNSIIGFSELLANEMLGPVEQRAYVEHADMVVKSSHQLLAVVNNVIDVARLDNDLVQLLIAEVGISEIVDAAIALVKALSVYKEHEIRVAISPEASLVLTDGRLLRQVVYNLLSNAVKFSPERSEVKIAVSVDRTDVLLEVEDHGCGIDAQELPRLAGLFSHAESAFNREHDGLGVGLYLVKRCLEKLGGRLSFKSTVGEGTQVSVVLPGAAVRQTGIAAFAGAAE